LILKRSENFTALLNKVLNVQVPQSALASS